MHEPTELAYREQGLRKVIITRGLTSVVRLDLCQNFLTSFTLMPDQLPHLRELLLDDNQLKVIPKLLLLRSNFKLSLRRNKLTQSLIFDENNPTMELDCSECWLNFLPVTRKDGSLPRLGKLQLTKNSIRGTITVHEYPNELDLSYNRIERFLAYSSLTINYNLSHNRLREVKAQLAGRLDVSYNPLRHCDLAREVTEVVTEATLF